jgi:hypothetical protein
MKERKSNYKIQKNVKIGDALYNLTENICTRIHDKSLEAGL